MEGKPLSSSLNISCEYVPHLYIRLLSWFISLPQFLSHLNNDLEWWNNCSSRRLISQLLSPHRKNLKQQTSYSSVRAQADRTLLNRQQILHPKTWEQADSKGVATIHLDFAFYTSHLLLSFGFCIVQNRASCCCCPVTKFCLSICEPMYSCTSGFPVLHCLPEFAQTRPLSWWCHPTTWSSVVSFSSCPQSYVPPIRKGN